MSIFGIKNIRSMLRASHPRYNQCSWVTHISGNVLSEVSKANLKGYLFKRFVKPRSVLKHSSL